MPPASAGTLFLTIRAAASDESSDWTTRSPSATSTVTCSMPLGRRVVEKVASEPPVSTPDNGACPPPGPGKDTAAWPPSGTTTRSPISSGAEPCTGMCWPPRMISTPGVACDRLPSARAPPVEAAPAAIPAPWGAWAICITSGNAASLVSAKGFDVDWIMTPSLVGNEWIERNTFPDASNSPGMTGAGHTGHHGHRRQRCGLTIHPNASAMPEYRARPLSQEHLQAIDLHRINRQKNTISYMKT